MDNKLITVTSPLLPNLDDLNEMLKQIWESKWITNNGQFHKQLEKELAAYLKVPYISLFTNGTLPLITALQALRITGEVITTPYSFGKHQPRQNRGCHHAQDYGHNARTRLRQAVRHAAHTGNSRPIRTESNLRCRPCLRRRSKR